MKNKALNVLIIGLVWPEPNATGASVRIMEHISLFQQHNDIITFACPAAKNTYTTELSILGIHSQVIEVNNNSFDTFIASLQPDVVLFDRFLMEEQFGWRVANTCPNALRIIETIDLHCLREARHTALKAGQAYTLGHINNETALREIAAIYRSDLSIIISDFELDILQNYFKIDCNLLHLCPFMLTTNNHPGNTRSFEQRQHFMTIGNFRHAPNWDAVLWLKQDIWPLIRKQLPQAHLHIYGAYTPPKATALNNPKEGFFIKDRAESVSQVMQSARLCLAPLRFGAGIKTKLADAMVAGTPNVSTSIGAEGMHGGLAWSGAIADQAQSFADAAIDLYQDKKAWQTAQHNGFDIITHHFNHATHSHALLQRILRAKENLAQHRKANFIGQMLNHHHHRSTEFMSRWIEEKNKPHSS